MACRRPAQGSSGTVGDVGFGKLPGSRGGSTLAGSVGSWQCGAPLPNWQFNAGLCLRLGRGAHRLACDPLPCSPSSVAGAAASGSELENLATLTLVMQLLYHQGQMGKNLQNRKNVSTIQFFEIGKFSNSESLNFGAVFSI